MGEKAPISLLCRLFFLQIIYVFAFYFWLCWVSVAARGLSLIAAHGGFSLTAVCRLLIAVASLVREHRLWGTRTAVVAAHGLSS